MTSDARTEPVPRRLPRNLPGPTGVIGNLLVLLVVGWRVPKSERPLVLLVSPAVRRAGRNGGWYVRAYLKRCSSSAI